MAHTSNATPRSSELPICQLIRPTRVLIADDNPAFVRVIHALLTAHGFDVLSTDSGTYALDYAINHQIDLAILNTALKGLDGLEVLARMRLNPQTLRIPVLMLGPNDPLGQLEVLCLDAGADDFITKPVLAEVLIARVQSTLRRTDLLDANPLTALPGNRAIQRFLDEVVEDREHFWAVAYLDLDGFKAFNDYYSFLEGDAMLALLGNLLKDVRGRGGVALTAHVGGDDFVLGFRMPYAPEEEFCRQMVEQVIEQVFSEFRSRSLAHYAHKDRERGYIEVISRKGQLCRYPFVSISAALVSNAFRPYPSALDISRAAAEVKVRAKRTQGCCMVWDERALIEAKISEERLMPAEQELFAA